MALIQSAYARGVATLTLDSPANRNALSQQLMSELLAALDQAAADDSVRLVELRHTGTVFCSGADLKETQQSSGEGMPVSRLGDILRAIVEHPKPVLAVVNGPARAGGLGLIAAADVAVCSADAHFAFTEVRIGVIPAVISAVVLSRISSRAASELFLTGDVFGGVRAAEIGLVTKCVPAGELEDAARAYAESLVLGGPEAMRATKQLLRERPQGDAQLAALSVHHFTSAEGREGVAAAREKRRPSWLAGLDG